MVRANYIILILMYTETLNFDSLSNREVVKMTRVVVYSTWCKRNIGTENIIKKIVERSIPILSVRGSSNDTQMNL